MPQLSTTFIFYTYLWTWLILYLIMNKTKMMLIHKTPMNPPHNKSLKSKPFLPWT